MRQNRHQVHRQPRTQVRFLLHSRTIATSDDADEYNLNRNGKNNVDLSLPVRLANLAAGAKLDIYKLNPTECTE